MQMENFEEEENPVVNGPGWTELQTSVKKLRENFNILCDSLEKIVELENTKLVATGRVEIPDTSRSILDKEQKFIEKFRHQLKQYKHIELKGGDNTPEYVPLYRTLNTELQRAISALNKDLIAALTAKTVHTQNVIQENVALMAEQQEREQELCAQREQAACIKVHKNTIAARCTKLEQQMEEKNNKIKQLQVESTVTLWNREKKRLIGNIQSREKELEQQLRSVADDADETKHRLEKRIEELQTKLHIIKVRNSRPDFSNQETIVLKRNLFRKERLVVVAESELKKQHTYYVGLLKGLQKDYSILKAASKVNDKIVSNNNGEHSKTSKQTPRQSDDVIKSREHDFNKRLRKVVDAVVQGEVTRLRASLPSHYLGYNITLKKDAHENRLKEKNTEFTVKTTDENTDLDDTNIGSSLVKWRLANRDNMPTLGKLLRDIQREHPSLIDSDGCLQVQQANAFFPSLTEEKITNCFHIFRTWDDNGDMTLDTSEIIHNLPGMLGKMSTVEEVVDAITEIDMDESGTIDFYEFLMLVKTLESGEGEAQFFQKNDLLKASTRLDGQSLQMSKTCSIQ